MENQYRPGSIVHARGREWIVLPEREPEVLRLRPLTTAQGDEIGLFLPLEGQRVRPARFADVPEPSPYWPKTAENQTQIHQPRPGRSSFHTDWVDLRRSPGWRQGLPPRLSANPARRSRHSHPRSTGAVAASARRCSRTGSAGGSTPRRSARGWAAREVGAGNTRRETRTTPRYSPTSTPNSTACRSAFQRASSGKEKNIGVSDRALRALNVRHEGRNS